MSTVKNLLFVSSTGIISFVSIEKRRHIVNAFNGTCLFLFPLKKWKKFLLSWCSQRVRKRPFALNGLLGEKFLRIMFNNGRYKIVFKISILYLWYLSILSIYLDLSIDIFLRVILSCLIQSTYTFMQSTYTLITLCTYYVFQHHFQSLLIKLWTSWMD